MWLIHCIGYFLHKSCLLVIGQHYTGKNLVQCLSKRLQTTMHRKKPCSMLSYHSQDNIAQVKTLCNVVLEAPDNNAQEKILFNVVLTFLGQHCTSNCKNLVQCYPRLKTILLLAIGGYLVFYQFIQKSQGQKPWPLEIPHDFFLVTHGNSTSFLNNSSKFKMLFLWHSWKFHILNPPVWFFLKYSLLFEKMLSIRLSET